MRYLSLVFVMCFSFSTLFAQDEYVVQVATYSQLMSDDYFTSQGVAGVYSFLEHGAFFAYYTGKFDSESAATAMKNDVVNKGFKYARVVNLSELKRKCSDSCTPDIPEKERLKVRNVFFDFDQSYLRSEGKVELDKLYRILTQYPSYTVEIHAHTDGKGSNEYNIALSERRQNSAVNYLLNRGIAASRIKSFKYGESEPIAKNELGNGQDTPEGRQFNRRVEIRVKEGGADAGVVEEINIPENLKAQ